LTAGVTETGSALVVLIVGLACTCLTPGVRAVQDPAPRFRAGADLVTIDVQVVLARGTSVLPALTVDLFEVRVAGQQRTVVSAVFVHYDEGAIVSRSSERDTDPAPAATCVFRHLRSSAAVHAHYRLAIDTHEADRKNVAKVRIKVSDKTVRLGDWAWRSATGK
jgi:hypothetical protein